MCTIDNPVFAVIKGIVNKSIDIGTQYHVNGTMVYSVYLADGLPGLSMQLKASSLEPISEKDDNLPDISFLPVKDYKKSKEQKVCLASEVHFVSVSCLFGLLHM